MYKYIIYLLKYFFNYEQIFLYLKTILISIFKIVSFLLALDGLASLFEPSTIIFKISILIFKSSSVFLFYYKRNQLYLNRYLILFHAF